MDARLVSSTSNTRLFRHAAHALVSGGADMATAQLRRPSDGALVLVAQVGFEPALPAVFSVVTGGQTPCARAIVTGHHVHVPDVVADTGLLAARHRALLTEAGSRACTSFPVFGREGSVVGVISAHYRRPLPRPLMFGERVSGELTVLLAQRLDHRGPAVIDQAASLRRAFDSRNVIAAARDVVAGSVGCTAEEALQMLALQAQFQDRSLPEVAAQVVRDNPHLVGASPGSPRPAAAAAAS